MPTDVTVSRQVLAEPDAQLTDRTWATLADGTPLVTAQRYGKGLLVLFHVTADTRWSDLPLSGTFVDMLRRIVALANATVTADSETPARPALPPAMPTRPCRQAAYSTASAPSRRRRRPPARCPPISMRAPMRIIRPASMDRRKAWSRSIRWRPATGRRRSTISPLNARVDVYRHGEPLDLRGPVFLAALALLMLDALVVIVLSGGIASMLPRRRVATTLLAAGLLSALSRCNIRRRRNRPRNRRRFPPSSRPSP